MTAPTAAAWTSTTDAAGIAASPASARVTTASRWRCCRLHAAVAAFALGRVGRGLVHRPAAPGSSLVGKTPACSTAKKTLAQSPTISTPRLRRHRSWSQLSSSNPGCPRLRASPSITTSTATPTSSPPLIETRAASCTKRARVSAAPRSRPAVELPFGVAEPSTGLATDNGWFATPASPATMALGGELSPRC
jgi:hypothetical protein